MGKKLRQITEELKRFFDSEFCKNYFTIIYGSYAYGAHTSNSDLDFVAVSRDFDPNSLRRTLDFAFDLYRRHNLAFDDEVPHEKKILTDYKTLEDAIVGEGFERRDGRIHVPPVVKTKEFLSSKEIAMRLLLNAMTSKNIFVSGDDSYYSQKRKQAFEHIVAFMFSIGGVGSLTIPEFVQSLMGTPERHGEMYLGYKDKPVVREYLTEAFGSELGRLATNGTLMRENETKRYSIANMSWLSRMVG